MVKRAIMMGWLILVSGCAASPAINRINAQRDASGGEVSAATDTSTTAVAKPDECSADTASQRDTQLKLNMINTIVDQGALYAALAHLDAMDKDAQNTPPARYLRAEILRRTGRSVEAGQIYRELLKTCLAGAGYHGAGLIAAQGGDLKRALTDLKTARDLLPTDPKVRNDYGYALLLDKEREAARREFITAMQLGDSDGRAAMNYLTLLFVEGKRDEAMQFAERTHVSREEVDSVQRNAEKLRLSYADGPGTRVDHVTDDEHATRNTGVKP